MLPDERTKLPPLTIEQIYAGKDGPWIFFADIVSIAFTILFPLLWLIL